MATCPVCQSTIDITTQHYGTLYTCSRCNGVFFIDWNGQPELASHDEPAAEYPPEPLVQQDFHPDNQVGQHDQQAESPAYPGASDAYQSSDFANTSEQNSAMEQNQFQPSGSMESPPAYDTSAVAGYEPVEEPVSAYGATGLEEHSQNSDYSAPNDVFGSNSMAESAPTSTDFADVAEFGNSEATSAAFSYSVQISGIDTKEVRKHLEEALTDSKFGWDSLQLMGQIKDGTLTIRSVGAVKASILIQRIKYLPVKISWRQDVLSGSV